VALQTLVRSREGSRQRPPKGPLDELMKVVVVLIGTYLLGGALVSNLFSKASFAIYKFNNFSLETYS